MPRFLLSLIFCLLTILPSQAHPLFQNSLWVEYTETELEVKVQVSVKEICTAAGLVFDPNNLDHAEIEDAAPKHLPYLLAHLQILVDGTELQGNLVQVTPPVSWVPTVADKDPKADPNEQTMDRLHFFFQLKYACPKPPSRITISQSMMKEFTYAPGTPFNFSYLVRVTKKGETAKDFGMLSAGGAFDISTAYAAPNAAGPAPRTWWASFKEFVHGGVTHVLTGYDHLLFAAALVLALRSFWEVFKIIGIFSLAHATTVTLSSYQLINVPSHIVEPLIAASIVFVALENIFYPRGSRGWRRIGWTFFFGLVHGLGLAGALVENLQGFTVGMIALAIVAFCVGVEIGHLCIVGPMNLLMSVGRQQGGDRFSDAAMRYGSLIVAIGGFYFFFNAIGVLPEWLTPEVLFNMT